MTLQGYGFDPRRALHKAWRQSSYARTALIDNKPVAMWGVTAPLLGETAYVWLVMSDDIAHMPRAILTEAKRELSAIMQNYQEVATTVLPNDEAAIRFALHLGFHDHHDEEDEPASHKTRLREVMENPRHRIPVGDSFVIGLGYHGGHA